MTDTESPPVAQPSSYLNHAQIEAAFVYLTDNYPLSKWTNEQREAWGDVLCQLKQGELKQALAVSARTNDARFRPDAYGLLAIVNETRDAAKRELARAEAEANANHMRDLAKEQSTPEAKTAHERVMEQHRNLVDAARARKRAGERKFRLNSEVTEPNVEAS